MNSIKGGCLCGNIRYETSAEMLRAYRCHCRDCQKVSGGGHLALFMIPEQGLNIYGELKYFEKSADSGNTVALGFCPDCGSSILGKPRRVPGVVAIAAGSLDDSSLFKPTLDIFTASAPAWTHFGDDTLKFPGAPA